VRVPAGQFATSCVARSKTEEAAQLRVIAPVACHHPAHMFKGVASPASSSNLILREMKPILPDARSSPVHRGGQLGSEQAGYSVPCLLPSLRWPL
jgi:hypothetical protein